MNRVEVATHNIDDLAFRRRTRRFCRRVLRILGKKRWRLSVLLCDNEKMQELNRRYAQLDYPTDVLSFSRHQAASTPLPAGRVSYVGDIAVSVEMVRRNAVRAGISANEELKRVLIHGALHLDGMDHGDEREGPLYEKQERVLELCAEVRLL